MSNKNRMYVGGMKYNMSKKQLIYVLFIDKIANKNNK